MNMMKYTSQTKQIASALLISIGLSGCGGASTDNKESENAEQNEQSNQASPQQLNALSLKTETFSPQKRSVQQVSQSQLNATGSFNHPSAGAEFNGNISTAIEVSDEDGIDRVLLGFNESSEFYVVCDEDCTNPYSVLVGGISPQLMGVSDGELTLSLWVEDGINDPVNVANQSINWQGKVVSGVSATLDETNETLTVGWTPDETILRYNVYIANDPNLTKDNSHEVEGGDARRSLTTSTVTFEQRSAELDYYIIVSGVDGTGESAFSDTIILIGGTTAFPPSALNDQYNVNEDQSVSGNVLDNDTSNSNESIVVQLEDFEVSAENGQVQIAADGNFTYTPNSNFNGNDQFSYQIVNESGLTSEATVSITVNPINDAPTATDVTFVIDGNTIAQTAPGLLTNAIDIDGDALSVTLSLISLPRFGNIQVFADGSFNYTAGDTFANYDNFEFEITDGQEAITVQASIVTADFNGSFPAIAVSDSYSTNEDTILSVTAEEGLKANDFDDDGDISAAVVSVTSGPSHGSLNFASDGSFSYTPTADFFGQDMFQYALTDADDNTTSTFVTIEVIAQNDAPVANDDFYSLANDSANTIAASVGVLKNDADVDGDSLTVNLESVIQPSAGSIDIFSDGRFVYTPTEGFVGTDSFTYQTFDGTTNSGTATVTLAIFDVFADILDNETLDIPLSDISDLFAGDVTINNVMAEKGTATFGANGITYVPNYNEQGIETLTISYSQGEEVFVYTLSIRLTRSNQAPQFDAVDPISVDENTSEDITIATFSATDAEQHNLTYSLFNNANVFALDAQTGELTRLADAELNYEVSISHDITIVVTDEWGLSDSLDLTIAVNDINEAPNFISAETANISENPENGSLVYTAQATDVDADDSILYSFANSVSGLVVDAVTGAVTVSDPSAIDHETTETIQLQLIASDSGTLTDNITVSLTVNDVNEAPMIESAQLLLDDVAEDFAPTSAVEVFQFSVTDSDDNDSLTWTLNADANFNIDNATGTISIIAGATFDYEAISSYTLTATVTDSGSLTDQFDVTLPISNVNEAPTANVDYVNVTNYSSVNIDVLINDTDPENDTLTVASASAANGSVSIESDDSITYTPEYDISSDTITYTVQDSGGLTHTGSVEVTVDPLPLAGNHDLNKDGSDDISATYDSGNDLWTLAAVSSVSNLFVVENNRYYPVERASDDSFSTTLDGTSDDHEIRAVISGKVHVMTIANLSTSASATLDFTGTSLTTNISDLDMPASFVEATAIYNGSHTNEGIGVFPQVRRGATIEFNSDGTGSYSNQKGKETYTWSSSGNQITVIQDVIETDNESMSVEDMLSLGVISQTQYDDYIANTGAAGDTLSFTSVQDSITLTFDTNQVFYFDVTETQVTTYTLPTEFSSQQVTLTETADDYRLYDLSHLGTYKNNDITTGNYLLPYFEYADGEPEETVTEKATLNADNTGQFDDLGINFTWAINTDGHLAISTDDNFEYVYSVIRGQDDAYAKETYVVANDTNTGEKLSALYFLLKDTGPSNADVLSAIDSQFLDSSFGRRDPDAFTNGILNGAYIFGFKFDNVQADNARSGENASTRVWSAPTFFQVSDWTWSLTDTTVTLIRYIDFSQGFTNCDPDTNATCFPMQKREFTVHYIDNSNGLVWLTETQEQIDFNAYYNDGTVTYLTSFKPRINFYLQAPLLSAASDTASVDEDNVIAGVNVTDNDVDSDGGSTVYLLSTVASNGTATVDDSSTFSFTPSADFNGTAEVDYLVTDNQNGIGYSSVNITVNPINDAPTGVDDSSTLDEGDTLLNLDLLSNDSDVDDDAISVTSVSTATNGTVVDNGDGTVTYTHDGSETTSDTFTYTVSDGTLTDTATVTLTISPVNDAPEFTTSTTSYSVDEGQSLAIDFDATDVESNTITYSFSADAAAQFSINSASGELTFAAQDYETPIDTGNDNSYSVTVDATDDGSPAATKSFAVVINVQNVNEAPTLASGSTSFNVDENQTAVTTVTASDIDAGDNLTFSLTGTDASLFSIGSGSGVITFNSAPDFEAHGDSDTDGNYNFDVVVTDAGGLTDSQSLIVTVDNVNEAATFTSSATISVAENQTAIMTVTANDPEGDSLDFSKNGGADGEFFSVTSAGVLTFSAAPDFEGMDDADSNNVFEVQIDVIDAGGSGTTVSQTVQVTITDANESPSITSGNTANIDENSSNGSSVYTPTVTDPENDSISWTIADGSGIFAINSATGEVTVNDNSNLDFENLTTTTITLNADDGASTPASLAVTVAINDVVENVELQGDATFGYSAVNTFNTYTSATSNDEDPVALVQQSDGKLLHVVNHTNASSIGKLFVVRTSTDGKNDITYGVNGQSYVDFTDSVTATKAFIDGSDNLYIIGYQTVTSVDTAVVIKLDSSGNLDTNFSGDGLAEVSLVSSGNSRATDLLQHSNGSFYLAATGITSQAFETLKIVEVNPSTGAMTEHFDDDALGGGSGGAKESNVALVENSSSNLVAIGDHAGGAHNQIYMSEFDLNNLSSGPVATGVADYSNTLGGNGGNDYVYSYVKSHTATDRVYIGGQTNVNTPDRLFAFAALVDIANVAIDASFGTNGFYYYDADPSATEANRVGSIAQDSSGNIVLAAVVEANNYPDYYLRKLTSAGVDNQAGDVADFNTAAPNVYPDFLVNYSVQLFIDVNDTGDNVYFNFTARNIFSMGADLGFTAFAKDGTESTSALRFAAFSAVDETFYAATELTKGTNNGEIAIASVKNDGEGVGSTYSYVSNTGFVDKTYHFRGHLHFNGGGDVDVEQIGVVEGADGDLIIANFFVGDIQIYKQETSGFADATFVDPAVTPFTSNMVPTGMVYDSANDHIIIYGYDAITSDDLLLIRINATNGDLYDPGTGLFTDAVATLDLGGNDRVIDVLPQADGSMIVFGSTDTNVASDIFTKLFIMHLNTDGSIADTTFDDADADGTDDVFTFALSSAANFDAIDVVQTTTNEIFVVGNLNGGTTLDIAKFDLTAKALDANFGTAGVSTITLGTDINATGLVLSASDALYLYGQSNNGSDYDGIIAEIDTTAGGLKASFNGFTNQSGGQGYFLYDEGGNETIDGAIYTNSGQLLIFDTKTGVEGKVDIRMTLYDIETDDVPTPPAS